MLNVYEMLDKFKTIHPSVEIVTDLTYRNEFYNNDFGGYKLIDPLTSITYYLLHYTEFNPDWKFQTGYDKPLESDAFFVPAKFIEQAVKEKGFTTLVFIIDGNIRYLLPIQLKVFYDKNRLKIDNNYGEIVVPVPIKLLNISTPFKKFK